MRIVQTTATIAMVVFLMVSVATAHASFTDINYNPHRESIEQMADLGILNGYPDGSFRPEGLLNRAAAAKVAAFLLGYTEENAQAAAGWDPMFSDVYVGMKQHEWAIGWINLVANDGVIKGVPGGEYKPGDELQMVQWVAILTRILGHEEEGMGWPDDYNQMGSTLGLTANLAYSGSATVNRAEMARMTTTAIFDVTRPDGKKIVDIVGFETAEDEPGQEEYGNDDGTHEKVVDESVRLSVSVSERLLPAGGGQTTQISAYVTQGGSSPVEGVPVGFFANEGNNDRSQQLSATEATTDANGMVTVTYTTLAADDNKHIFILANTPDDGDWIEKCSYILASNEASLVTGRIIDPFTGEPYPNADISFFDTNTSYYIMFERGSDEDGYYSVAIRPGSYHIRFHLDLVEATHYSGGYTGSHHNFKADNTLELRIERSIGESKNYSVDCEMGIIKGVVTNLGSHREIYIYPTGGGGTTVIANVNPDGSFMVPVTAGSYSIDAYGGHALRRNVQVEKGQVTDLGSFSR